MSVHEPQADECAALAGAGWSVGRLSAGLTAPASGEVFEDLLRRRLCGEVRIERILSSGTPEPVLYDQTQDEWVVLLQGRARLWVEGRELELAPGDYLWLPAHTRHRVLETSAAPPCLWLAVHLHGGSG